MKRVFLTAVLCIAITVGLCACQGQGSGASTQSVPERDFVDMTENYEPLGPVVE